MSGAPQHHWPGGCGVPLSQFSLDFSYSLEPACDTRDGRQVLWGFVHIVNILGLTFITSIFVPNNSVDYINIYFFSFIDLLYHVVLVLFAKNISPEKKNEI